MKINYRTTKLEKICKSEKGLIKNFGAQAADKIIKCIQSLNAADNLEALPPQLRPHPREPKSEEVFQIDVLKHKHSTRLFFTPTGEYDILYYATIEEIEILSIEKTHS